MYVSDDYRTAFVHIPKTGGTAFKDFVLRGLNCRRVGPKHGSVSDLPDECSDYFIFSFVRNPYRRLASMYRFRRLCSKNPRFAELIPNLGSLLDGVNAHVHGAGQLHPLHQVTYLDNRVTVFRYEDFDAGAGEACARIGIPKPDMPRLSNNHYLGDYDWREIVDRRAHEIINDVCRDDFERFDYPVLTWEQLQA